MHKTIEKPRASPDLSPLPAAIDKRCSASYGEMTEPPKGFSQNVRYSVELLRVRLLGLVC
jgi:hypothetical protein